MKKTSLLIVVCLSLFVVFAPTTLASVEYSEELFVSLSHNVNDVPYITTPEYSKHVLANGVTVYLVEDNQLPIVEMQGYILGGRTQESPATPGVADLVVQMMNTGTVNLGEVEFSRYKETYGLDFNVGVSSDYMVFSGNSLSLDQKELIALAYDVLKNPDFAADYYARNIQQLYQLLSYALYRDALLLDIFFYTSLFPGHPYSNGTNVIAMLQAFPTYTPQHLQDFYDSSVDPANIIMTIVGDINEKEMLATLEAEFGAWKSPNLTLSEPEVMVNEANFGKIMLVNKPDATQAKMKMGYNFYDTSFGEKNAFQMANNVFGSGTFSSRLMDTLRSQKGYVYGVYSTADYSKLGGLYYITTDVAPDRTYEAMNIITDEMTVIQDGTEPITEQELFNYVNFYNAFYPQTYRHKIDIMGSLIYGIETEGKSDDYLNEFVAEYNSLTAAQAQQVFSESVYPDQFLTVIIGNKDFILPAFAENDIEVEVIELF